MKSVIMKSVRSSFKSCLLQLSKFIFTAYKLSSDTSITLIAQFKNYFLRMLIFTIFERQTRWHWLIRNFQETFYSTRAEVNKNNNKERRNVSVMTHITKSSELNNFKCIFDARFVFTVKQRTTIIFEFDFFEKVTEWVKIFLFKTKELQNYVNKIKEKTEIIKNININCFVFE